MIEPTSSPIPDDCLPNLVYIGDVPVRRTVAGSALLYRLLVDYPPSKLLIVEGSLQRDDGPSLPEVTYRTLFRGPARPYRTRFRSTYARLLFGAARWEGVVPRRLLGSFVPQAVLTIAHGSMWRTAASLAQRLNCPLHLIVHDDGPAFTGCPAPEGRFIDLEFGRVYRGARSRLCIGPNTVAEYQRRYGVMGQVLYPLRDPAVRPMRPGAFRDRDLNPAFTVGYAGSLYLPEYVRYLLATARALGAINGRLIVYTPRNGAARSLEDEANVAVEYAETPASMVTTLARTADALLLPMSFEASQRANTILSFPSKLAEYTACGLPLLVWGPEYCSAVRWVRENPDSGLAVTSPLPEAMREALTRLSADALLREGLARGASAAGSRDFDFESVRCEFLRAIQRAD